MHCPTYPGPASGSKRSRTGDPDAGEVLVSWSHQGRFRSEAAFASFAGVSPIPASSGLTNRHHLNRSGDRQLNRAMYTITLIRMRLDPATKSYVARRIGEGKTSRDAQRCLQRAISRQLFNPPRHGRTVRVSSSQDWTRPAGPSRSRGQAGWTEADTVVGGSSAGVAVLAGGPSCRRLHGRLRRDPLRGRGRHEDAKGSGCALLTGMILQLVAQGGTQRQLVDGCPSFDWHTHTSGRTGA
ncbi:transposase [Streptomyces sp. NPDC059355]|uniref:transposase n=1 Tax=Streptomyces sp. NPDC059355 TaxID=3346811 RepID=UPI0036A51A7E